MTEQDSNTINQKAISEIDASLINPMIQRGSCNTANYVASVLNYLAILRPVDGLPLTDDQEFGKDILMQTCSAALRFDGRTGVNHG